MQRISMRNSRKLKKNRLEDRLDLLALVLKQEQKVWEDMLAADVAEEDKPEMDTVQLEMTTRAGLRGEPARVDNGYLRAR